MKTNGKGEKKDKKIISESSSSQISINGSHYKLGLFYGNKNSEGKVIVANSRIKSNGDYEVTEDTYFIDKENVSMAVDGDLVLIDVSAKKGYESNRGIVISVLKRNLNYIAGEVVKIGTTYYLNPVDKRLNNLTIALEKGVENGDRVLVSINGDNTFNQYIGKVVYNFEKPQDDEIDILWEAAKCGIVDKFSEDALKQAKTMPQEVLDSDRIGRMDLKDLEIFTIDGDDTKDIDDAVSCQKLDNGNYLVGVHIADVSHYVKKGSPLDKDAFKRGTSTYLGGTVIPMLPKELSNGICSLNPNVERLAMSCMMEVDKNGNVVNYNIWKSVIKSRLKMTYAKVNDILKNQKIDPEYQEHASTLIDLNRVALILRKKRIMNGSIEFDRPELRVKSTNDRNVFLSVRTQDVAENLIGELMILANETVDKHLTSNGWPCLHRVHDIPNVERLSEFLTMMDIVGVNTNNYSAEDYAYSSSLMQELSSSIKETGSLSDALSANLIRCMSRAKYSPINIGHNGLAKTNYCHFTSPIRRYPDLVVHRIVKDSLVEDKYADKKKKKWNESLSSIGGHSSKMERSADEAERNVLYLKCIQFMKEHIGEDFEGTIIGISNKDINVQLKNYIEGKVRISSLPGTYEFDPKTLSLISRSGKDNYYLGDELSLKVIEANLEKRTINFKINEKLNECIPEPPKTLSIKREGKK